MATNERKIKDTGPHIPNRGGRSVSEYNLTGSPISKSDRLRARLSEGPFEYTLAMPYIPDRGGRVASNYNLVGTQRRGNASYRPNKRDVLGNSGSREF